MAENRKLMRCVLTVAASAALTLVTNGATNIAEHVCLAEDADWRGRGTVVIQKGAAIDLAGRTLKVDGVTGSFAAPVDATTSSGAVEASTIYSGNAAFLFDDDIRYMADSVNFTDQTKNHRVCFNGQFPFEVTYDFGEGNETRIRSYRMYYQSLTPSERAPRDWTFSGSNDKESWTTLDTRSNVTDWKHPDARTFSFGNVTAFRYYRLSVTAPIKGGVMELYQLEYFPEAQDVCDETGPASNRVTSSTVASGNAAFLFDNDFRYKATPGEAPSDPTKNHRVLASTKPFHVTYDFGEDNATILNAYRIYFNSSSSSGVNGRAPAAWTFQGSNDNANWATLDSHANETNWVKGTAREFYFSNGTPYRYYRLHVTEFAADGYLEMYQLEYFSRPMVTSTDYGMTDLTEPGEEHLTGSSTPLYGSVSHLFDNIFTYRYDGNHVNDHRILVHQSNLPFNIVYDFGAGANTAVAAYRIYYDSTRGDATRAPSAWTFDGSNDGTSWTTLDSRTGETLWSVPDARIFYLINNTPYRYYRLHVTATNGDIYFEIYQLEYFGQGIGTLLVDVPANASQTNSLLALGGQLRLIKDGAGTFTAAVPNQTYSCGTIVSNGTLRAGLDGGRAPLGLWNEYGGKECRLTVCANGTFDVNGLGGWWRYPILLSGGTLACAMAQENAPADTFRSIALDADSRLDVSGNFVMGDGTGTAGQLDLGGHTLTASVASNGLWTLNVPSVTQGAIAFDLAKGDAWPGKKVMAWESGTRPANVLFTRAEGSSHGVAAQEDGVYAISGGITVIVR